MTTEAKTMKCKDCNNELTKDTKFLDMEMCIDCAVKYRYCLHCGTMQLRGRMRADMCGGCFREHPVLADASCRVSTDEKLGVGDRYFGVELEAEVCVKNPSGNNTRFKSDDIVKQIKEIDELVGDNVLLKRDGSLSHGIEIVTRPATLHKQYGLWNKFFSVKHPDLRSFDTKTCGLHVHVSREGLDDHAIAKTVCFINSETNKKFMFVLAGRTVSDFTKFKNKSLSNAHQFSGDRYEAVNLANAETIEFRMFRGTLKKESLFKAIEFCDAILEYCSQDKSLEQSMSRSNFVRFVNQQCKWPHLAAFIKAKWYGVSTELSEQVGWAVKKQCNVESEHELVMSE